MKGIRLLVRSIDAVSTKIGRLAGYTMLILIVSSSIEIIYRYFFNSPTIWAYELGQMIFGSYFLLAGAMTLRERGHIGMDLFLHKLTPRGRATMNAATFILTALFCGILIWKGWEFAFASLKRWEHSTSVWGPPIYPYKLMLPLASLLLLAQAFSNFLKDVHLAMTGERLISEEE